MFAIQSIAGSGTVTQFISNLGYLGVFILMTIESAGLPIPSEVIMPYGGFLAVSGGIPHLILVSVVGTLGTGLGSTIGYVIGAWGGKPIIDRYGKYIGVNAEKMLWAEKWFCKYGESAVIYTRLLPVVRTIVNVPAGLLSMDFKKFLLYTLVGAFPWCFMLACLGYILGANWRSILGASHLISFIVAVIVAIIIVACIVLYILVKRGVIDKQTLQKYFGWLTQV